MLNLTGVNRESWAKIMPPSWQFMRTPPAGGAYNMAVDTAMLALARETQAGFWRCYGWDKPTISFGRHEAVRGRFDAASVARANMEAVRRPTGGRTLLHAAEVTYSVAVPVSDGIAWRHVYAAVNTVLVRGLRTLGVPVELAPDTHEPLLRPTGALCFDQPAPGELVVAGAKLVGSAVWRERGAYLQHGSILLHDTQHQLAGAIAFDDRDGSETGAAKPRSAALAALLTPPPRESDVATALEQALTAHVQQAGGICVPMVPLEIPPDVLGTWETHYRDDQWLWRR